MLPQYKFALREDLKDKKEFLPTRGEPKATGWDVRSTENIVLRPFEHVKIKLGFRAMCPEGWWFELKPRSSSFGKKNLHALYGTIDETYSGELIFACQYIPNMSYYDGPVYDFFVVKMLNAYLSSTLDIRYGEAIGQIIPVKRQEMEVIEATNEEIENAFKARAASRGDGGFGSTSK